MPTHPDAAATAEAHRASRSAERTRGGSRPIGSHDRRSNAWAAAQVSPQRARIAQPGPPGRRTKWSRCSPITPLHRRPGRPPPLLQQPGEDSVEGLLSQAIALSGRQQKRDRTTLPARRTAIPRALPPDRGAGKLIPTRAEGHPDTTRRNQQHRRVPAAFHAAPAAPALTPALALRKRRKGASPLERRWGIPCSGCVSATRARDRRRPSATTSDGARHVHRRHQDGDLCRLVATEPAFNDPFLFQKPADVVVGGSGGFCRNSSTWVQPDPRGRDSVLQPIPCRGGRPCASATSMRRRAGPASGGPSEG